MAVKKKVGAPKKPDKEKKVGFTVTCKSKNVSKIKSAIAPIVKELDK